MPTSTHPRQQLAAVPDHQRRIYLNVTALRNMRSEIERPLVVLAMNAESPPGPISWNPTAYSQNILASIDPRVPAIDAALRVLEADPEFNAADRLITPILAALAELEQAEAEAAQAREHKRAAHDAALAKARDAAFAKAMEDPDVVKTRRALEAVSTK